MHTIVSTTFTTAMIALVTIIVISFGFGWFLGSWERANKRWVKAGKPVQPQSFVDNQPQQIAETRDGNQDLTEIINVGLSRGWNLFRADQCEPHGYAFYFYKGDPQMGKQLALFFDLWPSKEQLIQRFIETKQ